MIGCKASWLRGQWERERERGREAHAKAMDPAAMGKSCDGDALGVGPLAGEPLEE